VNAASVLDGTLYGLASTAVCAGFWARATGREREWKLLTSAGIGLLLLGCLLHRAWFAAGVQALILALVLGPDWWNRRGRKAARTVGAKSRALLAAVVERAREAGSRSPVPEGARA
jgi:hypothetical protein